LSKCGAQENLITEWPVVDILESLIQPVVVKLVTHFVTEVKKERRKGGEEGRNKKI
jgi:hypothetical protein